MGSWWQNLTVANQVFYAAALFFSVFFVWQFIAALIGLGGHEGEVDTGADVEAGDIGGHMDVDAHGFDAHVDVDAHDIEAATASDAAETIAAFKLVSIRSILAFFMMFCWAGAMYLNIKVTLTRALIYALLWGLAGMLLVALVVNMIRRLAETGTKRLASAVGTTGMVYMNIPEDGQGQVRIAVSGVMSYVAARATEARGIRAGTAIRVVRTLGPSTVEVEIGRASCRERV